MATYIVLINFADQGTQNIKQIRERLEAGTTAAEKDGVRVREIHWTRGMYDAVLVADAPNGDVIRDWSGSISNVRTQTIPTLSTDEMNEILANTSVRSLSSCEIIQWSY